MPMRRICVVFAVGTCLTVLFGKAYAQGPLPPDGMGDVELAAEEPIRISDPIEPVNRVFFTFNDKLYFWVLKPVAQGYETVVPKLARTGVANFFQNLRTPVRFVNCTLQGDIIEARDELARFAVNSLWGVGGFGDPAKKHLNLRVNREDTGQTFGRYGVGSGIYLVWPVFGPSNVRDSVGMIGDKLLDPVTYITDPEALPYILTATERVNETSLRLGEYEDFKESALDPYAALRHAYEKRRRTLIAE